jgi:hypothetical protein
MFIDNQRQSRTKAPEERNVVSENSLSNILLLWSWELLCIRLAINISVPPGLVALATLTS